MPRNDAYLLVQGHAKRVWSGGGELRQLLGDDPRVRERLTADELDECFRLDHHLRGIDVAFARLGLGQ